MKKTHPVKTFLALSMSIGFAVAAAPPLHAQGQQAQAPHTPVAQAHSRDVRASKLIGKEVRNAQGKELGEIDNLVVDLDNGRVRYAVMSLEGQDKLFAIPVSNFGMDDKDRLVLNVDKEQLAKAPGFERDRRPNFGEETYRSAVDRFFFKEEITRRTPAGAKLVDATDLIGKEINDRSASNAGEVEDVVVNLGTGRAYAVMHVDQEWSLKSKLVALPFTALQVPSRPDLDLILAVDRPKVEEARGFKDDDWPDLNAPAVRRDIEQQLATFRGASEPQANTTQTQRSTGSSQ